MNQAERKPDFDPEWARTKLPPFDPNRTDVSIPAIKAYRQFYQIEFEQEFPGLQVAIGRLDILDYRIAAHYYQQSNTSLGTVFVLHGYYDHVGIFNHVIRALLTEGYSVVTFDLPGHGLSSGDIAAIPDFNRYQLVFSSILTHMSSHAPKPWSVVAQSTGGAITVDFVLSHHGHPEEIPFTKAVLLAPLIRPRGFSLGRYVHSAVSPFTNYIARNFTKNSHSQEFLHFLKYGDPLQSKYLSAKWVGALKNWVPEIESRTPSDFPMLVIQGQEDGTVDFQHNIKVLQEKFTRLQISLLPTARHQLANETADIRSEIFRLISMYLRS